VVVVVVGSSVVPLVLELVTIDVVIVAAVVAPVVVASVVPSLSATVSASVDGPMEVPPEVPPEVPGLVVAEATPSESSSSPLQAASADTRARAMARRDIIGGVYRGPRRRQSA